MENFKYTMGIQRQQINDEMSHILTFELDYLELPFFQGQRTCQILLKKQNKVWIFSNCVEKKSLTRYPATLVKNVLLFESSTKLNEQKC